MGGAAFASGHFIRKKLGHVSNKCQASSYSAHFVANPREIFPSVSLPVHVNDVCREFLRGDPSRLGCLCQCRWHSRAVASTTSAGTTKMRQASIFFGSLNQTKTTKSGRTSPLNKVVQSWGTDHWTFCDPCPVVFTAMRTFREPFAAMRSTAGAFIMPPVLTLPAVHPRTNNFAWTMSSPADPIACAI